MYVTAAVGAEGEARRTLKASDVDAASRDVRRDATHDACSVGPVWVVFCKYSV